MEHVDHVGHVDVTETDALYWEHIATSTRFGRYVAEVERRAILRAHELSTRPTVALDVGCEGGRWSQLLFALGWGVICTDIQPRSLAICRERIPAATCVLVRPGDERLPCAGGSVGLVLCLEVPSVVHSHWFAPEAFRVLQPGGLLVTVCWNRRSWRGLAHALRRNHAARADYANAPYWFSTPYCVWRERLRATGFNLISEVGYAWGPFRRASDSHLVPVVAQLERSLGLCRAVMLSPMVAVIAQPG